MPTFKRRSEYGDARQFTGGLEQGMEIVLWINSNNGKASWYPERLVGSRTLSERIILWISDDNYTFVWVNDWAMYKQDGTWDTYRPEDLHEEYEEV